MSESVGRPVLWSRSQCGMRQRQGTVSSYYPFRIMMYQNDCTACKLSSHFCLISTSLGIINGGLTWRVINDCCCDNEIIVFLILMTLLPVYNLKLPMHYLYSCDHAMRTVSMTKNLLDGSAAYLLMTSA